VQFDAPTSIDFVHRLRISRGILDSADASLRELMPSETHGPARAVAFIDAGLAGANPDAVTDLANYAEAHADAIELRAIHVVPGGERVKNDLAHTDEMVRAIHDAALCRKSYVLAIGGGAVLDAAGFAAAIAHRGVRLIRFPTTTLSQGDSGVGVKHGINAFGKKNYLGGFAPPWAVINDVGLLKTLSDRDWRCGFSEAVKVALVKDADLFELVESAASSIAMRDLHVAERIIARSAELHLRHIVESGDPFETTTARPLDFGHWSAHKLERITGFELRHGEAVAIGIAIDALYSARLGMMPAEQAERILACLESLGFALTHPALDRPDPLLEGIEEFREHLGGELTIAALTGIGRSVDLHEIDAHAMREAIHDARRRDSIPSAALAGESERATP